METLDILPEKQQMVILSLTKNSIKDYKSIKAPAVKKNGWRFTFENLEGRLFFYSFKIAPVILSSLIFYYILAEPFPLHFKLIKKPHSKM